MMVPPHSLTICLLIIAAVTHAQPDFVYLGNFSAANAAFLTINQFNSPSDYTLVISQFTGNPLAPDVLGAVYNLASVVKNPSSANVTSLTSAITWPNDNIQLSPSDGVAGFSGLLVGGGFLVPPKTVGAVAFVQLSAAGQYINHVNVSVDLGNSLFGGWFYHKALLRDVDGDGFVDVIAARAYKPILGTPAGQLVWMRQPPNTANPLAPENVPWQESILVEGSEAPDVFIDLVSLRNDADEQIVYTSFFSGQGVGLIICPGCAAGTNTWSNASSLIRVVLDLSIGQGFEAQAVDVNNDGVLDLLVTNHVDNATISGVYVYEAPPKGVPLQLVSAWKKHVIATGFVVREPGFPGTQAAPGAARLLPRCAASGKAKPYITLAGDGDQRFYVLAPSSEDPSDWMYVQSLLWNCEGTVGRQAAADVDGDGCPELFVPCYDSGTVNVFRLQA